jgi:hypothetical protein
MADKKKRSFWDAVNEVLRDVKTTEPGDPYTLMRQGQSPQNTTPEQEQQIYDTSKDVTRRLASTGLGAVGMGGPVMTGLGALGGALSGNASEAGAQAGTGTAVQKLLGMLGPKAGPLAKALIGGGGAVGQYLAGNTAGNVERQAMGEAPITAGTGQAAIAGAMGAIPSVLEKVLTSSRSMKATQTFDKFKQQIGASPIPDDAPHGAVMRTAGPPVGQAQETVAARLTPPKVQPTDVTPELRIKREKALEKRTALEAEIGADETARLRQGKERSLKEVRDFAKQQEAVGTSTRATELQNELTDLQNQLRKVERPSEKEALRNRIADTRKRLAIVKIRKEPLDTTVNEDRILDLREQEADLVRQRDQARLAQADKDVELLDLEIAKAGMTTPEWSSGLSPHEVRRLTPLAEAATSQEFFDKAYRHAMKRTDAVPDQVDPETIKSLYKVWEDAGAKEAPKIFQTNFLTDFLKHSYDEATGTFTKAGEVYRRVGHKGFEAAFGGDAAKADMFVELMEGMNQALPSSKWGNRAKRTLQGAAMFALPDFVVFHLAKQAVGSNVGGAAAVGGYEVLKRTRWRDLMDAMVRDPKTGKEMLNFLQSGNATSKALQQNRALNLAISALPGRETSVKSKPIEEQFSREELDDIDKVLGRNSGQATRQPVEDDVEKTLGR